MVILGRSPALFKLENVSFKEKKKKIWLGPMKKALIPTENSKKQNDNKNAILKFDNTTIANRPRTVSRSNDSHPACMVNLVYGIPTFLLTANAILSKGHMQYFMEAYRGVGFLAYYFP